MSRALMGVFWMRWAEGSISMLHDSLTLLWLCIVQICDGRHFLEMQTYPTLVTQGLPALVGAARYTQYNH